MLGFLGGVLMLCLACIIWVVGKGIEYANREESKENKQNYSEEALVQKFWNRLSEEPSEDEEEED